MTANKRRAIRNTLVRLGMHAKPGKIAEALEMYGIEVSEKLVSRVKIQMFRDEAKAARERFKRPPMPNTCNRPQQRKIPPRQR